jgi:putative copper resistance protein D
VSAPSLPSLFVSHWQLDPALLADAGVAAALYLWAAARLRTRWPLRRTLSFLLGLGLLLAALCSGLDSWDDRLLSVHMVQHMLLLLLAPIFLIGSRPLLLALRALPPSRRRRLAGAVGALRPVTGAWQGLAFYAAVVLLTHLPWFYDQTLLHPWVHDIEHLSYVAAGSLLLWPLLDGDPVPSRQLSGLAKLGYMLIAMLPMAIIGAYLNRHTSVVYAPYGAAARTLGVSAVNDQALAGAIMWVIGNTIMVGVGLWAVMVSLIAEERRQQTREARAALSGGMRGGKA